MLPSNPSHGDQGYLNNSLFEYDSDNRRWVVLKDAADIHFENALDSEVNYLRAFFYQGAQSSGFPVGSVVAFSAANLPEGFILADGSTFNQNVYPELYTFLGNTNILPDYTNRTFGFKVYDLNSSDNYPEVYFGIAGYNGAGFVTDSEFTSNIVQVHTAKYDSDIAVLQARVTELEGDLAQAVYDRVFTDNQLTARLDGHDSDIALRGRFYVQATPPSGGPNSGWVNTNTMKLHVWDETVSVWTEVVTT